MTDELFTTKARRGWQLNLPTIERDQDIDFNSHPVVVLVLLTLLLSLVGFVKISLGVTAKGTILASGIYSSISVPRSGKIDYVISNFEITNVRSGQLIARVAEPDYASRFNTTNPGFQRQEIFKQRSILQERSKTILESRHTRNNEVDALIQRLIAASDNAQKANDILIPQIKRLKIDLEQANENLQKGIITQGRIDQLRTELTTRELQFFENQTSKKQFEIEIAKLSVDRTQDNRIDDVELISIGQQQLQLEAREQLLQDGSQIEINSPIDGVIVPKGYKVGQVVQAGSVLFDLKHDNTSLIFQVDLASLEVGSLQNNLPAKISVDAFPFFEHGFIEGKITSFSGVPTRLPTGSEETLPESIYRLEITPELGSLSDFQRSNALFPGMTITAHLQKEKVPIWRIVFATLLRLESRLGF